MDRIIRFFVKQDQYFLYGDNAILVAEAYFKAKTVLSTKTFEGNTVQSCFVRRIALENALRFVLNKLLYKVEIWSQSKNSRDTLLCSASPGNIGDLEEYLMRTSVANSINFDSPIDSNDVVAFVVSSDKNNKHSCRTLENRAMIDVCVLNETEQVFRVTSFQDDSALLDLEYIIVQLNASEIIYWCDFPFKKRVSIILRALQENCLIIELKKNADLEAASDALASILCIESQNILKVDGSIAARSAIPILHICEQNNLLIQVKSASHRIEPLDTRMFVRMDGAAVSALNLVPESTKKASPNSIPSVFEFLNKCRTQQGSRLLKKWILQPLIDDKEIKTRLDVLSQFIENPELARSIRAAIAKMCDTDKISRRLQRENADLPINYKVYFISKIICSKVCELMEKASDSIFDLYVLKHVKTAQSAFYQDFIPLFEKVFDFEQLSKNKQFLIKSSYNTVLKKLRADMDQCKHEIENVYEKIRAGFVGKTVKLERSKIHGYHLRLTLKQANAINVKEFTRIDVRKDGVKFQNRALKDLSAAYEQLMSAYNAEQSKVVDELSAKLYPLQTQLYIIGQIMAKLDVLLSFATVSRPSQCSLDPFVRPEILPKGSGIIEIEAGRHPCMESICSAGTFVANDTSLRKDASYFQVITGPNMGGKSTYIRQVATIVLMAQIGCYVPCAKATISVVNSILARFGSRDYIPRGVSSFLAEMIEASYITKTATSDSFVIIDELGRGTSTYDGIGIASSIIDHLSEVVKCFGLFATHFHELSEIRALMSAGNESKEIAEECLQYMHMTAQVISNTEIAMLYHLKPGICDESFGIHAARMAGLPMAIIKRAETHLSELDDDVWNKIFRNGNVFVKKDVREQAMYCQSLISREMGEDGSSNSHAAACKRVLDAMKQTEDMPLLKLYMAAMTNNNDNYQ